MDDLTELQDLRPETILTTLQERFADDRIYTCIGDILIAVNPFKPLPIYGEEQANAYTNAAAAALPPHIYRTADRVYSAMCQTHTSQVCVISGESGAGKTETSKLFMQHIAHLSKQHEAGLESDEPLHDRILKTNVILETFGNAETKMNNNSSRFGKYVDLIFGGGALKGATIRHYLLEKSRITLQGPGERGYHIFYHLLSKQDPWFEQLPVMPPEEYPYLRWPDEEKAGGSNGEQRWSPLVPWPEVMDALVTVGFSADEIPAIMRLVLAVLELGRIAFEEASPDVSAVADMEVVHKVASLLGVDAEAMAQHMVETEFFVHGERFTRPNAVHKSYQGVEALAKCTYDALFEWLVTRMDAMLHSTAALDGSDTHIGILDIFGFENFKRNGFEQMCINVANERLQFFFNLNVFQMELSDYEKEDVDVDGMTFTNNFDTLDLFYSKSLNIFSLLDEESRFQNSNAMTLVTKLDNALGDEVAYRPCKTADEFTVKHFAGHVTYAATEFLDKNRDELPVELTRLVKQSADSFVAQVFAAVVIRGAATSSSSSSSSSSRRMAGRSAVRRFSTDVLDRMRNRSTHHASRRHNHHRRNMKHRNAAWTVSSQFLASLDELIDRMSACTPTFVRCIKPNKDNKPVEFDTAYVEKQLRYTGVFETTRIRKEGFSDRIPFRDFVERFSNAVMGRRPSKLISTGPFCQQLLTRAQHLLGDTTISGRSPALQGWRIGRTKVFLKFWHVDALSYIVNRVETAITGLQGHIRAFVARKKRVELEKRRAEYEMQAMALLREILSQNLRIYNTQQSLIDEDETRPGGLLQPASRPAARNFIREHFRNLSKARKAVEKWWLKYERISGVHCDEDGRIFLWFHGLLDRAQAEELLDGTRPGTFLVRVNERTTGYVLSFTAVDRYRHYKIHKSEEGGYQIFGFDEDFGSLAELVQHYQTHGFGRQQEQQQQQQQQQQQGGDHGAQQHVPGEGASAGAQVERADSTATTATTADPKAEDTDKDSGGLAPIPAAQREKRDEEFIDTVLECTHPLRLGDIDEVAEDGIDPNVKRVPKQVTTDRQPSKEEQERQRLEEKRRAATKFTFVPDEEIPENVEDRLPVAEYLDTNQPMPPWLYGPIQRNTAEEILQKAGMLDGLFLVREKEVLKDSVTLALSYCYDDNFTHHLLQKHRGQNWLLDQNSLGFAGPLNDVIQRFIQERDPGLDCRLRRGAVNDDFKVATLTPASQLSPVTPAPPPPRTSSSSSSTGRKQRRRRRSGALPALPAAQPGRIEVNGKSIPPERWLVDQVVQWLSMLRLQRYAGLFRTAGIAGRDLLAISAEQLNALVPDLSDQLLLKNALTVLKSPDFASVDDRVAASIQAAAPAMRHQKSVRPKRQPHSFYNRRNILLSRPEDKLKKFARKGNIRGIEHLLARHPKLHVDRICRRGDHKTPLFVAAEKGHVEVVRLLLRHGANPHLRNYHGLLPLEAAQMNRHAFVVSVLQAHIQSNARPSSAGTLAPAAPLRLSRLPPQAAETIKNMQEAEKQQEDPRTYMAPVSASASSAQDTSLSPTAVWNDTQGPPQPPRRKSLENAPAPPRRPTSTLTTDSEHIYDERTSKLTNDLDLEDDAVLP